MLPCTQLSVIVLIIGALPAFSKEEPAKPKNSPADVKSATVFAQQIETIVKEKNTAKLAEIFDTDSIYARALKDLEVNEAVFKGMLQGGKKVALALSGQIVQAVQKKDGSYKLLRVRKVNGEVRALFRILGSDGGVNYNDLIIEKTEKGKWVVVDLDITLSGELFSETIKTLIINTLKVSPDQLKSGKIPPEALERAEKFKELSQLVQNQKNSEALREWAALPDSIRYQKTLLILRFAAAAGVMEEKPEEYIRAMEDFQKYFPNDPGGDLLAFDLLFQKEMYKQCHQSLDRLSKSLGGDPYLDLLRASVLLKEAKFDEAKKCADKALAVEPELSLGHHVLLKVAVHNRKMADIAAQLTELEKLTDIDVKETLASPDLEEFVKSPEYRAWSAKRKK